MRVYSLLEEIENDCIVTRVRVYDEISPDTVTLQYTTLHYTTLHYT